MIKKFNEISGRYIEKVYGQERLAFAISDNEDFYDMTEWAKRGGYQGSIILFYDFENGNVYRPFEKQRNIMYGTPVFTGGFYYFLQGNFNQNKITLYRYLPEKDPEPVVCFGTEDVDLYNLRIVGDPVHVISQGDVFNCYYPVKASFPLQPNETVTFIEDGKVYIEAWIEEGWDEVNGCASDEYSFYYKTIVKDLQGTQLSEEIGALFQAPDGGWWMA